MLDMENSIHLKKKLLGTPAQIGCLRGVMRMSEPKSYCFMEWSGVEWSGVPTWHPRKRTPLAPPSSSLRATVHGNDRGSGSISVRLQWRGRETTPLCFSSRMLEDRGFNTCLFFGDARWRSKAIAYALVPTFHSKRLHLLNLPTHFTILTIKFWHISSTPKRW